MTQQTDESRARLAEARTHLHEAPYLSHELLRDLIDLRIAKAIGDEASAEDRWDSIADRIRRQRCPDEQVDLFRAVFVDGLDI